MTVISNYSSLPGNEGNQRSQAVLASGNGINKIRGAIKGFRCIYRVTFAIATVFKHPHALIIHETEDEGGQFHIICFTRGKRH